MPQSAEAACLFTGVGWLPNSFEILSISLVMDSAGSFVLDDLAVASHLDWSVPWSIDVHIHTLAAYSSKIPEFAIASDP